MDFSNSSFLQELILLEKELIPNNHSDSVGNNNLNSISNFSSTIAYYRAIVILIITILILNHFQK